ncbi:MAG TPA: non-ribosomal peptide synthase/polyketide synthase [Longimicrobium sp.]|nr:non-ribosomal peptide synthase/polyketide synthase [Longimicrobium sp.]
MADLLAEMREALPGAESHVLYGPTEGTILASTYPVPADGIVEGHPIGRPLGNVRLYVCDAFESPQPAGVPGELLIGGAGVARGYLGRAALTAEQFVPDPFSAEGGARLYRTGDRARWRVDGTLEFLGRLDGQVKIRGFRIEPGEIEAVLRGHGHVTDCVVVAREEVPGDWRLVAYVVGGVETDELREHVRRSLPEYMVPAAFVALERLPLTPNGKLDRKALPAPEYAAGADRYVAPRTPAEEVLAGIWAEVLRLERVGATDGFFELGGHSLLATRVVSRVREVFGVELPLRALFEGPTVAELAVRVEELRRAELPVLPPVVPVERTGALPLSFAQERLWFIDRLEPGSATYNIYAPLRLMGAVDERALEQSLSEIVRRHEALRTSFAEVDGSPVQVIAPFGGFALPVENLSGLSEADREAAVRRCVGEEAARPFDLAAGPLFRAALLRLGDEDHVLLLSMHHIASDGWSMGVLFREFSVLYAAYREGRESPLPELPVQYGDYAVWQREQLEGEVLDRQLAYWRGRLAGAPELLELPTDHPRPPVQTHRGATVPVELSLELLERLQALGRSEGTTLYMTLLGAFQVLLSKYAGSEDVVVGSPIAGRTRAEVEALIGFFVNTLVLRTDLSGDPSFRKVLGRVREATLGAYEHQELPFEKLVAELQPDRSLSHSPLFQVSFTLQNAEGGGGALPGLRVGGVDSALEIAKFDLSLAFTATPQGLRGALNYSTDLFERGTIERMLGHLERVLEQVADNPDMRLSRLALAGSEERAEVVVEWNRTERPFPREGCIHQLFEAQAGRTPNVVALVWGAEELTYRELDARANRLAHHLASLGVGPESRVGVRVERSVENVVATLAVLKAGGCCVPVDTSYPVERMEFMLADSGARVLLSDGEIAAGSDLHVIRLDQVAEALAAGPDDPPQSNAWAGNLAYVFYTSGSTGRPKGVMMAHREVVQYAACLPETMPLGPGDRVAQASNASFDAAVFEIWGALFNGATLVGIDRDVLLSAPLLGRELRERGITHLYQTAALFNQHVREQVDVYAGLRQLVFGAEAVGTEGVRAMLRSGKPARVLHEYGPTEATVWCTLEEVEEVAEDAPTVSIGRPIPNARAYVLDPVGEPLPVGVPGDLCIGGDGVVRGYLGRPGLTAERFVPDPFAAEPGGRMYRTGDRARWKADGKLEFLGRLDDQVKIRGFRIEPGEVEAAIGTYPGVREARVMMREDQPGDKRLVAYVVGDVEVEGLRAHLRQGLPEYMVPRAIVTLDRLPLNANGKVDRKALPVPEYAADVDRYVAPRTPVEEVLAGIWAEVLRLERVGVEESFFDLGGHSLLATRLVSRIRALFGVEVPLRALFEGPTVAELAERVEEMRRAGEGAVLPPLVPVAREAPLPLSFAQERLWFLHQLEPEGAGYHIPWSGRLVGRLDTGALERALGALTERHEALRTTFHPVEQGAVQVVHPAAPAHLPVLDLTGLAPREREDEARRLAREDAERPFDLERGPLLRATLLRLHDEEHVLLLTMHHIVSDGWSMGVLFGELGTLYEWLSRPSDARPASPLPPLPPLPVQYADFAVWQRGWLQGEVLQRQLDWWRERLGGAPPALELPTDRPRPAVASSRGAARGFRLSAEVTRGLRALARREGATLYMVTHAALDLLLSRWSGQEDLVVGSPIAGRTQVGTEGLIGFFVNTLALRVDLSGDPSFGELVRRVREMALGAYAYQELPFERLVEEVAPERGLSHTPVFQVMFALQNALQNVNAGRDAGQRSSQESATSGARLEPFGGEIRTVRFDLELDLQEAGEELFGNLRFRTDLFDAATIERFAAQYGVVLAAAAASPVERLSRLAILPDEEARTLLAYGSGPAREDAEGVPVHRLFAAQAARTPEAPALRFAGESLTYAQLDARAERLARRLRGRAVPGATIAICLERGPEAVVALLAVWKMGGVYLPLDPGHPVERLSFFLRDSGAKLVVADPARAGALLEREADVVLLDPSVEDDLPGGEMEAHGDRGPRDLAYLIYTSGSTGTPKAVMVEHAQLTHTLRASLETLGFAPGDVVAALASTSFDISLLELVTPLLAGAAVRIVPHEVARDPETLVEAVGDVSVLHAVPALMRQVVEVVRGGRMLRSLRLLLVGGDAVPPSLLEDMRDVFPHARTVVLYGPTEAAIICATYAVPAEGAVAGHPLGRPLPGVRLAVRGPRGELAPVGVPGEVWISGGGVARGYLGRPELNAEKFVSIEGERAYRTGDRARWRPDGVLEFLGRADEQVKVRGFRIEPGEIEAVLRGQPGVREAVVLAREDAPGDRRLVAYVVPGADAVETAAGREQVSEWETLFDDTYAQDEEEEDPALALKGWNSSYTGEPIPREEMRAWVEHTAERILALRPERVLEVGCGTGLLLFRVAPHTRGYHGTDFSAVALEHVRRHAAGLPQVSLSEREADDLAEFAGAEFDLVVVNSVAQYFPDLGYLLRVLEGAAAALRRGGRIFVGDVRSLPLAGAFHASVELARAPDDLSAGRLLDRVRRGIAEEQELLLDPVLFEALRARMPRLGRVEVQAKRGEYDNEVSRFRYDVVLHLDAHIADTADVAVREWGGEDAGGLRTLVAGIDQALLVRGVPDARVREHARAYERVSAGGEAATAASVRALAAEEAGGIAPEALFALGEEMGRVVEARPGAAGTLDVLFNPSADVARFPAAVDVERPWESYANDPQWGRRMRALVPALREAARARLPEYMVPSAFVVMEAFPVTPNGKVDRAALPAPDTLGSREGAYVAPRTPAEERMAGIWAEVLGVERVGGEDNFFDLGGHSLLATQLISRVREAFRTELPLRAVFEAPSLAELAGRVEALRAETPGDAGAPPLVPVPRDGSPLPLSFAQQRLWFIDQLEPGSTTYNMPSVLPLRGRLDARVLERALAEVVRRHEALRTTFGESEGVPFQVVHPAGAEVLELTDLSGLAAEERETEARRLVREEVERPFDLRRGPLLRTHLLRLGEEEHVLVLAMHHIVSDGWSMGVLTRELDALYVAFARGEASPLPELPVQYADYAAWQRKWVAGDVLREQAEYWKAALSGAPELLELPTDRARPARQDYAGVTVEIDLGDELSAGLRALSKRHGATLFMTLLAGWAAVLGRLSGQDDVVVGTPTANRGRREIEELIGFFVNTLALRVDLSERPTVAGLLEQVKQRALEAQANQDIPFEQVVELVQPARSMAHAPLFQVLFTWQNASGGRVELSSPREGDGDSAGVVSEVPTEFDLSLSLEEAGERIVGSLTYATSLFERATVDRWVGYLRRVLEEMAADDTRAMEELEILPAAERRLVVEEWNRTDAAYPAGSCIHELFEEQVERAPGAVAVEFAGEHLTYAELNARANRLAHHLRALGVGPEARVGICVERGPEMVVGMLAVLKAGGAYLPLDPAYPDERLRYMLDDGAPAVLLTESALRSLFAGADVPVVELGAPSSAWDDRPASNPERGGLTPDHLAYVIYTSGSTGRPKGVRVPHASVNATLAVAGEAFGFGAGDRVPSLASFAFDIWLFETLLPLLGGGTVRLVPRDRVPDVPRLVEDLAGCTALHAVPALMRRIVEEVRATPEGVLRGLRRAFVGGDAVAPDLLEEMRIAFPAAGIHVLYGPTEAAIICAAHRLGDEAAARQMVGRPLGNAALYVVERGGSVAPVGAPGELCLGGASVARDYLGRPGLTAERFVPDPFPTEPGARLYRTGDRVRWLADGTLEFLGRTDRQVKVRGFRIEPGEIEARLREHPAVREAAVLAREDAPGDRRLVAYVVGADPGAVDALRAHLSQRLPEYMVPSAFVVLETLPLTPNGKVDRNALPAPEYAAGADGYVAPRTPAEEVLAGIWAEVLKVERVGVEGSFFELGGHSLLATRVVSRVRAVFGVELPLRSVFERPVLSGLAAEIERLRGTGAAAGEDAIAPAAREGDLPVTFAQERLWFVDALDPGSPVYAIPFTYLLTGGLDADALRRALTELVRRHEPLRTALPAVDGVPVQRIAPPPASFDLPVADLRHLPVAEGRAEAVRLAAEAARHRFDLASGPLFRASLVHVGDAEHLLLLNLHHAIGDGWSVGVLREELSALYGAFSRGLPSPLPEPALQYADYAVWQRELLSGAVLEQQAEFWRQALDGAPALLELPADRPRPPVESHRGAVEGLFVSAGLTSELHALARREGATLFMVLLAALDVVLGRLAGQEDVVVGAPIAGRTRAETDRMVGLFLNSLALRTDLSGDPTFRELLGRVRETTLDAYAHQELPFERVLEEVRPERSLAHAPVFQVMLNLANFEDGDFRAEGLEVAGGGTGAVKVDSKFDLTLYVSEGDRGIGVTLVYAADLFDAPRMRGLLAQLEGVLRQAVAAPETRIGALSLATEAARGVLPDPAEPLDESWRGAVHEVFAARAAEAPDALAVEDPRERWTYAELDAATGRIARALTDAGVGVGDVVAITGHRSAALVRALVGTMKSGAAFLVLDPAYPSARLAEYVRIARPAAHLHLAAAGDLPREALEQLGETIRTTVVIHPRSEEPADAMHSVGDPLNVEVGPDTLAYLSFTSGTTGTPKAVMGRHSSLTHFTPWLAAEFGLHASDRFSLLSGLAHDPLHRDVFTPLQLGAAVVAPEPEETGTPGYLARWMREAGVSVAHLTPAMGQLLADASEGERIDSLRRAFFVGDVLRRADVQRLVGLAPGLTVINYYGSTETQRAVSYHVVDLESEQKEIIPLGRGIPGVQLLVRNASGEIAGIGEVGEIWMRSPHLAAGYLNDPALAAERFVANPWTEQANDRLYRTGDLGRYRPDGEVEPLGRADQQVKVRGFRVELGEVESALASHPAIKETAVIARETEVGDRRLVAYWVPVEGSIEPDVAPLRAHLKALLPEYMVPSAYVRLERLPLTANGKLDRRALPEPEPAATDARSAEPRTPTEEILAQIWAEVLRKESVGVDDDFFALGGHSLLATRVLSRVQNALGVVLPLRAVFEGPTVAELAARVDALRQGGLHVLPPVVPVDRDRPLPLSFAQERLWFLDRLDGGSAAYNLPGALFLGGTVDVDALERALGEIVRRHETLRTVFREVEGGAVQVIAPFAGLALPVHDLSGLPEPARETEVRRRAAEDAARPFDLAEGPLFRAALLRVTDEEYVLLLCIHHIVSDGWSTGVLHRELGALYAAFARGEPAPLPPLPVQYADFAVWQREQLQGEVLDRQIGYWKERLEGAPALLELPTDRPRPPVQSHRGAREMFDMPRALLDRLQALGRSEGATLYMVMLGAFQLLLSKYSGSQDIVVGSPIAGRTRREVEELIGLFVNTLVLRTDLSGDPTFRELLGRVREGTLGAYEHQEVPFERLVAELQPERSLSHSPLFQVMFILQNADRSGSGISGGRMAGVGAEVETTRFDLSLTAVPHDGGVYGGLEYSTALFDRSTARRMLGHLARVLEQVAADADVRLSQLELLSAEERGLVLDAWNRTEAEYPADWCIHELFEAQAERTPGAAAVVFEGEELTYAELNARANRLAHHLRERGVGPDVRVGICVERGLEMVVGLLGVLKAGGAYVPLDPGHPAERLAYVLADSAPAAVLTQRELRGRVESVGVLVLELDAEHPAWADESDTNPVVDGVTAAHLAYVMYTSGSTGRPKGVSVPHRGVINLLRSIRERVGMEPADGLLAVTTYAFDISVLEIFLPLLHGARTIVLPRERAGDPAALADAIRAYAPTVMQATPATWRMLVQAGWEGAPELRALCGGEALPAELASTLRSRVAGLWNVYGPTETTIWSTAHPVPGDVDDASRGGNVAIGRPLANTRVYLLDDTGEPVPVGVAGELWIGGAGVVRGYLGRPELTAERFVADAYGGEPGARLYRTGDRVRWLADGTIEFLGRTDFQVKVRGFRIELGEIEARLAEHAAVREAVVMAREDVPGDVRLVAYVVGAAADAADGAAAVDAEALRAHLSASLPAYMVPAAYVRLERLPLTPNGKLDRKALPAPDGEAYAARAFKAPLGEAEEALAEIWSEVLGVERVSRWAHFFELGGHSLLAVRVISRVRQTLGVEAALGDLFLRPVLADFARGMETAARAELPPIEPVERTGRLPLSFAQQRLWFMEQLGGMGGAYNIPIRLPLPGELDRDALRRALDAIVARHEALRTTFAQVDGVGEQRIAPAETGFRLGEHDLSGIPTLSASNERGEGRGEGLDAAAELGRLLAEEARTPFDLERGPLVRGRLIRLSPEGHVLAVTMHHIVSDAWSMELFIRELSALYDAFRRGEPDPLPALPVQYADYAAWQRRWVEGDVLQSQAEYWKQALAGAPELLELPTDRPRPARQDHAGAAVAVELDQALTAGLKALGQRHGTTLFMTLLAGWAAVLGRLSGQSDVVVGTPTANRGRIEIEELIGFFVNTLAVHVDLAGSPSVAEVLARVKERALGAQQNQDIPFEQVVELVQPVRSMAHTPLFQVMFGWQNASRGGTELTPGSAEPAGSALEAGAKFDLSLDLSEQDGRIVGALTYATALFDRATVERHVGYLRRMLEEMAADERQPVERLALMPADERSRVVEEWNRTDEEYPADRCIHELFEAQAERTPGAVAVVFAGEELTYAELNRRANRLAHHLRALGVGPDVRVGICMERSLEMVVGLLAVLKAGGAYVPLDPGHPAERLAYVLADSAPAAVLTQRELRGRVESAGVPVLELDAEQPAWADESGANPVVDGVTAAHLAYVMYTSGSTGRPKGVVVPHRGVINLLRSIRERVGMEPADGLLAVTTYAFDISVLEIFLPLLHGARTIVLPRERAGDPAAVADAIRAYAPTVMQATPATWRMLVQAGWQGAPELRALCGGEALPAELASALRSRVAGLWNVYGPTETTIWSTVHPVRGDSDDATRGGHVPVGRPVANTRVYLLDDAGEPVPVGVAGELWIGGAGVVRGYLGRPELTAERFVADPFSGNAGARLYRTGDLARWRPDGTIEFLGRTDFQVKVRGFRIELGEIEARLAEHPAVREAVVVAREDVPGDVRLVAYVVGAAGAAGGAGAVDAEALRAHLSASLPAYMVPTAYVRMETLPLTPNGKVDRKALPAPEGDAYASREYEAPVGKIEVALAQIWAELLRVERVGRRDNFFQLGGHSLLALQVVSRVRHALEVELPLAAVFDHPVLSALAERTLELRLAQFDPETLARLAQLVRQPGA